MVSFSDGAKKSLSFTQGVYDKTVAFVRDWPELPVCQSGNGLIYVAHYGEVDAKSNVRNYTVCFDPDKRAALWVAYPLHSMYTSGSADATTAGSITTPRSARRIRPTWR